MFPTLRTERLQLRRPRPADAEALWERRNVPEVAHLQSWTVPYDRADADTLVAGAAAMDGPADGEWWMLTVTDPDDTTIYGDLALHLTWGGRTAEVGYTFGRQHWGNGYATEALHALLAHLFDEMGITRATGQLHPDNLASARVLERCGFVFEGHTANSFWVGEENSDDWIYGLTPELWRDWNDRPRDAPETIELLEPYPDGLRHVLALGPHQSQQHLVAPIAHSLAQVAVPPVDAGVPVVPWPRVVHADGEPVGFVMMEQPNEVYDIPFLWRLVIDRRHQGRGIGRRVVEQVIAQARSWEVDALQVSWVPGIGSPGPFYESLGFVPTGEVDEDEIVAKLTF